jgi:hypothetical protein
LEGILTSDKSQGDVPKDEQEGRRAGRAGGEPVNDVARRIYLRHMSIRRPGGYHG